VFNIRSSQMNREGTTYRKEFAIIRSSLAQFAPLRSTLDGRSWGLAMKLSFVSSMLIILLALAGCDLTSTEPLLKPEDGEKLFSDTFVAVALNTDNGGHLDEKGKALILDANTVNNYYEFDLEMDDGATRVAVSFH